MFKFKRDEAAREADTLEFRVQRIEKYLNYLYSIRGEDCGIAAEY